MKYTLRGTFSAKMVRTLKDEKQRDGGMLISKKGAEGLYPCKVVDLSFSLSNVASGEKLLSCNSINKNHCVGGQH